MSYVLGITGTIQELAVQLCDITGNHICYEVFRGIDVNETHSRVKRASFNDIAPRIARLANIEESFLKNNCKKIAVSISGTDQRYDFNNLVLLGELKKSFTQLDRRDLTILSLAEAAYNGVLENSPGIVLRAGVGSSIYAKNLRGKTLLAYAWGFLIGDPGSGFSYGKEVLRIVAKEIDGIANNEEKKIVAKALRKMNLEDPIFILEELQNIKTTEGDCDRLLKIRNLADVLFNEADNNNSVAIEIITNTISEIVNITIKIIKNLGLNRSDFYIFFQGSLFESHPSYAQKIYNHLKQPFHKMHYIDNKIYYSKLIGTTKKIFWNYKKTSQSRIEKLELSIKNKIPDIENKTIYWKPQILDYE